MSKVAMPASKAPRFRFGRIIRRLILGLVSLVVLFVLFLSMSIWFDGVFGRKATEFTNVSYTASDNTEVHAYLSQPENSDGQLPAVVMFHEWWGLNSDIITLADALAAEGYVVLAPDAYRTQTTRWIPRAIWLVTQTDEAQIANDIDAGFDYLIGMDNVDSKRIGSTGFCFGGRQSLNLARRQQEALSAMVSLYGTAHTDTAPLAALPSSVPLLGIFGEDDQSIPADDVRTMDKLMDDVGLDHEITIYPGVGHAFINGENYADANAASGQAWDQMVAFLGQHLRGEAVTQAPVLRTGASKSADAGHLICLVPQ
ncbi:MAG: dienelactone hydrolase family protein [Candidatus Promineifilaceae bacterium]